MWQCGRTPSRTGGAGAWAAGQPTAAFAAGRLKQAAADARSPGGARRLSGTGAEARGAEAWGAEEERREEEGRPGKKEGVGGEDVDGLT